MASIARCLPLFGLFEKRPSKVTGKVEKTARSDNNNDVSVSHVGGVVVG